MEPIGKPKGYSIAADFANAGGAFDIQTEGCQPGTTAVLLNDRTVVVSRQEAIKFIEISMIRKMLQAIRANDVNEHNSMDPFGQPPDLGLPRPEELIDDMERMPAPSAGDSSWRIPFHRQPPRKDSRLRLAHCHDNVLFGIARRLATTSDREERR